MVERWILNASPLIVLANTGYEGLIRQLASEFVVPRAVAIEILAGPVDDRARLQIAGGEWPVDEAPRASEELQTWDLGAGETAVLSYAIAHPGWTAILDDGAARRCARTFSVQVKGSLGIVLMTKKQGLIDSAASVLETLRQRGFRLDEKLISAALKEIGEAD